MAACTRPRAAGPGRAGLKQGKAERESEATGWPRTASRWGLALAASDMPTMPPEVTNVRPDARIRTVPASTQGGAHQPDQG